MEINLMAAERLVSPANIQSELTSIWDSLESANKMRACLFNLIIYTKQNTRTAYVRTIAQKVIEKFPSRIIFISVDKDPTHDYLKAKVSVMPASEGEYDI